MEDQGVEEDEDQDEDQDDDQDDGQDDGQDDEDDDQEFQKDDDDDDDDDEGGRNNTGLGPPPPATKKRRAATKSVSEPATKKARTKAPAKSGEAAATKTRRGRATKTPRARATEASLAAASTNSGGGAPVNDDWWANGLPGDALVTAEERPYRFGKLRTAGKGVKGVDVTRLPAFLQDQITRYHSMIPPRPIQPRPKNKNDWTQPEERLLYLLKVSVAAYNPDRPGAPMSIPQISDVSATFSAALNVLANEPSRIITSTGWGWTMGKCITRMVKKLIAGTAMASWTT